MAVAEQSVRVTGDNSQVVTVGRDLVVADTYVQQKPNFFKPNLEILQNLVVPRITPQFVDLLRQQKLLVLGGRYADKTTIARHIARFLSEVLQQESESSNGHAPNPDTVPVLEWSQSTDQLSLATAIQQEATPTIFLLPNLLPQHINYDLNHIHSVAVASHHYVVITTDRPLAAWKLSEAEKGFWQDLNVAQLFGIEDLVSELIQQIQNALASIPEGVFDEQYEPDQSFIGGLPLRTVAERLGTPSNIAFFVQLLSRQKGILDSEAIDTLIKDATDNKHTVEKWYHTVLNSQEQFLALSLSFFDGLFDDQFFGALEQLVTHIRNRRDPSLRSFDYCDIDNLQNFFDLVDVEAVGTRFQSRSSNQRRCVFEAAWHSHRRQILSALPVITHLAVQSVNNRSTDWELYGTRERRDQLRRAIGDGLSDIGLISITAVQHSLLELAGDKELGVQAVAARALARWREYDADDSLFVTLERWQQDARIFGILEAILEDRETEKGESPLVYIRATVALTVGYAAGYDAPNTLAEELRSLLQQLADDRHPLVRDRFRRYTLPRVVSLHLVQLRDMLHDMTRYVDLTQAIGASLAIAYQTNRQEVLRTLTVWHDECLETKPKSINVTKITPRDALLMTLAFTYGEIEYDDSPTSILTADEGFSRLQNILVQERHPKIRSAVVIAISRQARRHFERVEPQLQKLVAQVTDDERIEIVKILTSIYLEQRGDLTGGTILMEFNNRKYWVWINNSRPLTSVETAMIHWIKNAESPVAQQIGIQASIAFAQQLEQVEAKTIAEYQEVRKREADQEAILEEPANAINSIGGHTWANWYTGTFVPWLAAFGSYTHRRIIGGLLPEALAQNISHQEALNFVLRKWQQMPDAEVNVIAQRLRIAILLHPIAWLLLVVLGLLLLSLINRIL